MKPSDIFKKFFERAGVEGYDQLRDEEKMSFKLVEQRLRAARPVSIDDFKRFLEETSEELVERFSPDDSDKKKIFLWAQLVLCRKLIAFIQRPDKEIERIKQEYNLED